VETLIYLLRQIKYNRTRGAKWSHVRYYFRWRRSMRAGASSLKDRSAWLTFPALDHLGRWARPEHRVFEYGGGGSTLFWCDRVGEVITVEHDPEWFKALEERMALEHRARWTGHAIPADPGTLVAAPDPAEPEHFASADPASIGRNYRSYVTCIDRYPNGYFDAILIDGRGRTSCIRHSIPKLKRGGLLILDNAERSYYTEKNASALADFTVELGGMAPVIYNRDPSETRIYRKPG
jgi:hypothetical protein